MKGPRINDLKWPHVQVRRIAKVDSGFGFPREEQGLEREEYPFFKVSDMNWSCPGFALRGEVQMLARKVPLQQQQGVYHWRLHVSLILNEATERLGRMEAQQPR